MLLFVTLIAGYIELTQDLLPAESSSIALKEMLQP